MKSLLQIGLAAWWSLLSIVYAQAQSGECDRSCLETLVSDYLTALAGHDPSQLPTAPGLKYTENVQVVSIGTGEWPVAGPPGNYRHVFSDPESNQVAAITTITENGVGVIYVIRLKLGDDGKISEIETQITRDSAGAARYENMSQPEAVWLEAVPAAQRLSRDVLVDQVNKYYSGMQRNDPNGNYSFFDKDCNRMEDALQTTNMNDNATYGHSNDTVFASLGCEAQFQTGFLGFVTLIRDRRFPVIDEERQAVFAITILDQNGTVRELPDINGTSEPIPPYFDVPRGLAAMEAFRLRGDKLYRIEMTLIEVPYGTSSPFLDPVDLRGNGTNLTVANPCDGACLDSVVDQVLQAMLAHDASSLPLAQGVRYSENGQFLALGDGMWETLGQVAMPGASNYSARFTDPASGTAAYWGLTKEFSTPGVLALRIKVDDGQITEIEAIDVRAEYNGTGGGTLTLMRPPLPIEWTGDFFGELDPVFQQNATGATDIPPALTTAYFDGLELHSSTGVPFTSTCTRRDNGVQGNLTCAAQMDGKGITPNGLYNITTTVRDRRILVTDTSKGVVMAVVMIDNLATGPGPLDVTELVPSTYMVPQLIKVDNGSISRVESMIKWMPFGYISAWANISQTP